MHKGDNLSCLRAQDTHAHTQRGRINSNFLGVHLNDWDGRVEMESQAHTLI